MQINQPAEQRRGLILSAGLVSILLLMHLAGVLFPKPPATENRRLAALPAWPASLRDLQSFTRGIDAFVKDHFPARTRLIGGLNWLRYQVGDSGVSSVIVSRQGWLYLDNGTHLGMVGARTLVRAGEIDRWTAQIDRWTRAVAKNGGHFYLLIPPDKERVYPEYAPSWYVPQPNTPAEQLARAAQARGLENFIYLLPEILRVKSESPPAYGPHDTHWTGNAAHAAYLALADHLRTTDSPISAWPIDRYTGSYKTAEDLQLMLGITEWIAKAPFPLLHHPETVKKVKTVWLTEKQAAQSPFMTETGNSDGPVLLLVGDSFRGALLPVLQPHFRRIISTHYTDQGIFRQDLIDRFAPDVVVLEVVERDLVPLLRKATK